jgi:hypothetical protein
MDCLAVSTNASISARMVLVIILLRDVNRIINPSRRRYQFAQAIAKGRGARWPLSLTGRVKSQIDPRNDAMRLQECVVAAFAMQITAMPVPKDSTGARGTKTTCFTGTRVKTTR